MRIDRNDPHQSILDSLEDQFLSGDVHGAIRRTGVELRTLKTDLSTDEWKRFTEFAQSHPIKSVLHQDPFSSHSYRKPRGYSGDADLLDYMYGAADPPPETTEIGREIFSYTARTAPAPISVRERLEFVSNLIDRTADQIHMPRVLSVACGHLREIDRSTAVQEKRLEFLTGLDADPRSLAYVRERLGETDDIRLIHTSVARMLSRSGDGTKYHLIYSLGLYDYLNDRLAARLTTTLFNMLDRGGTLLIANFAARLHDAGYMESFMAWPLVFRSEDELRELLSNVDGSEIGACDTHKDTQGNIVYLHVVRK